MDTQTLLLILLAAALVIILALIGALLWIVLSVLSRLLPGEPGKSAPFQLFRTVAAEDKLNRLGQNITKRAEELKSAAQDLGGEAKAESESLIAQAEQLTTNLKTASTKSIADIKPLIHQGAEVMEELERQTRKLASGDEETRSDV